MDKSLIANIIQWSIWGVLMVLIMGWLNRSRSKKRPENETKILKHPLSTLIIGGVCFSFFFGAAILSNVFSNGTETWWTTAIFLGFAAMSLPLVIDYFAAKHSLSESGIDFGRFNGQRVLVPWDEISSVRYAYIMKWFVIKTKNGKTVRVSAMLMGLPEFAKSLLELSTLVSIDEDTMEILKETRNGNPPSVWA
ncbi:hypothetical protein [Thalassomonas sp. M1454]|uniref:hypothetical protein n=1 Tax=Thalassomonas sp. M1454 TaxID=2594477 RepID=UPI00117D414E|nr:hypothetical protein [Thalassomonas sp. M1454]TRX55007.1 hypothetical protein FNN08_10425 [Thalassomonas sp. M1454]